MYEEPGSRQQGWQEQPLCEDRVEIRRRVGARVPGREHHHHCHFHDDKDGEGDDLDPEHMHLPT